MRVRLPCDPGKRKLAVGRVRPIGGPEAHATFDSVARGFRDRARRPIRQ